jgi:hypothetical protein
MTLYQILAIDTY